MDIHRDQAKEPVEQEIPQWQAKRPSRKPWKVYYGLNPGLWRWRSGTWHAHGAYATIDAAVEAFRTQVGKEERRDSTEQRRWAFRLVGPEGEIAKYQPNWSDPDE